MRTHLLALPLLLSLAACVTEATGSAPRDDSSGPDAPLVSDNTAATPDDDSTNATDGGAKASEGGATGDADAAPVANVALQIDGWTQVVQKAVVLVQTVGGVTDYSLMLDLAPPPGSSAATRLSFLTHSLGDMCGNAPYNTLMYLNVDAYLPDYTYRSGSDPMPFKCGLDVTALPTAAGKPITGTFSGTLTNGLDNHVVKATFSVVRGS